MPSFLSSHEQRSTCVEGSQNNVLSAAVWHDKQVLAQLDGSGDELNLRVAELQVRKAMTAELIKYDLIHKRGLRRALSRFACG